MPDWTIKAGDLAPAYEDTLTLEDGSVPNFSGATLQFVMRSVAAAAPVVLTGSVTIVDTVTGAVRFDPAGNDTTAAGTYMAVWRLIGADLKPMSFPTVGYISVTVEPNPVTDTAVQLVSLTEAKEYLGIDSGDRRHDARLSRYIRAALPTVQNITGPIIPTLYDEWHHGGGPTIQIRRRPSTTYGTTAVLDLESIDEFIGSTLHPLTVIDDPSEGSTYSCMIDRLGTITRRTGGGGITAFAHDVHITYTAGQATVPANVVDGTLEILRANWQTTRPTGTGRMAAADDLDAATPLHFYVPRKVAEMLAPNRRAPSTA